MGSEIYKDIRVYIITEYEEYKTIFSSYSEAQQYVQRFESRKLEIREETLPFIINVEMNIRGQSSLRNRA